MLLIVKYLIFIHAVSYIFKIIYAYHVATWQIGASHWYQSVRYLLWGSDEGVAPFFKLMYPVKYQFPSTILV